MAKVIAVVNQKGGVGKTTTSIAMAACLVQKGYKVLLVDVDDSGDPSLTKFLGFDISGIETLTDILLDVYSGKFYAERVRNIIKEHTEGMFVLPADNKLSGATLLLSSLYNDMRTQALITVINGIKDDFDYIILDAAPALNLISTNLFIAADECIIVSQPQGAAEGGINEIITTLNNVKNFGANIKIKGLLLTMVDSRTNYNRKKSDDIKEKYGELGIKVFNTKIPRAVKVEESAESGMSIISYDPKGKATAAYQNFVNEYLEDDNERD